MSRWRDVKKGIHTKQEDDNKAEEKGTLFCAHLPNRLKAFIVDIFLIMMPILYITTYMIMEGKEDFQGSEIARWVTSILYGIIIIAFWVKNGQTPGFKAYEMKVIDDETKGTVSFSKALLRYLLFIVSAMSIIGLFLPFFRKDRRTLHDLLSKSCAIDLRR